MIILVDFMLCCLPIQYKGKHVLCAMQLFIIITILIMVKLLNIGNNSAMIWANDWVNNICKYEFCKNISRTTKHSIQQNS